jgi:hypothetical protein
MTTQVSLVLATNPITGLSEEREMDLVSSITGAIDILNEAVEGRNYELSDLRVEFEFGTIELKLDHEKLK